MVSEKRIASITYPVKVKRLDDGRDQFLGADGVWLMSHDIADALNAAREDAERYQALRAILQGDALVLNTGLGTPALRGLARMEHALTDCTAEEIDEAVDAARAAQERDVGGGRRGEPRDT